MYATRLHTFNLPRRAGGKWRGRGALAASVTAVVCAGFIILMEQDGSLTKRPLRKAAANKGKRNPKTDLKVGHYIE